MSRPAVHNAFDDTLIGELGAAFESLDADPDVRVIRHPAFDVPRDLSGAECLARKLLSPMSRL
jgi:1,4-dihydroxy-2-naphthoyl-CoA synthase